MQSRRNKFSPVVNFAVRIFYQLIFQIFRMIVNNKKLARNLFFLYQKNLPKELKCFSIFAMQCKRCFDIHIYTKFSMESFYFLTTSHFADVLNLNARTNERANKTYFSFAIEIDMDKNERTCFKATMIIIECNYCKFGKHLILLFIVYIV